MLIAVNLNRYNERVESALGREMVDPANEKPGLMSRDTEQSADYKP